MNYRHAFHAGNFADVFKHILLTRILVYLMRKDQPLRFMDTHAGPGRYDLASEEANRTDEWRNGIARIANAERPAAIDELIAPWLEAIGPCDEEGKPQSYPGSPALAQKLLRPQDKIALNELHERDCLLLRRNFGRDNRVRIASMDGYTALNAWTPPVERRGLALIDPPFEVRDEFTRIVSAISKAWKKWPTGCYAIWYPIKDAAQVDRFYEDLSATGIDNVLRLELSIDQAAHAGPLTATGFCIVNPPFILIDEANTLLPWLVAVLAKQGQGSWRATQFGDRA